MKIEKKYQVGGALLGIGLLLAVGYGVQIAKRPLVETFIQEELSTDKKDAEIEKQKEPEEEDIADLQLLTQITSPQPPPIPLQEKAKVPVYICGEVIHPGVYYMEEGAIIDDLLKLCGGLTPEAAPYYLNLASPIIPNEKIVVPKEGEQIDKFINSYENREEYTAQQGKQDTLSKEDSKVNINTANVVELQTLPGIGQVKAEAIINYRQENGTFQSLEELLEVSGIGDKTLEKLKALITL